MNLSGNCAVQVKRTEGTLCASVCYGLKHMLTQVVAVWCLIGDIRGVRGPVL